MIRVKEEELEIPISIKYFATSEIGFYIKWHRLHWKASMGESRFSLEKLAGAWINCPHKPGQPQKVCRNIFVSTLQAAIPNEVNEDGKY
jgi:hypothetical protein